MGIVLQSLIQSFLFKDNAVMNARRFSCMSVLAATNFFMITKGELWTSTGQYCMNGITRGKNHRARLSQAGRSDLYAL